MYQMIISSFYEGNFFSRQTFAGKDGQPSHPVIPTLSVMGMRAFKPSESGEQVRVQAVLVLAKH